MRQAGFEAAKKAGDAKKAKLFASKEPDKLEGEGEKEGGLDEEALKKLDNSGPVGMPPPSGTTEAEDAKEPETKGADVESKADETPIVESTVDKETKPDEGEGEADGKAGVAGNIENLKDEGTDLPLRNIGKDRTPEVEHPHGTMDPVITATGQKTEKGEKDGETQGLEEDGGLKDAVNKREDEKDAAEDEDGEQRGTQTEAVNAVTDEVESLPGKKTQDQAAAKGDEAGISVGD